MTTITTVIFDVGLTLLRAQPTFIDVFVSGCAGAGFQLDPSNLDQFRTTFGDVWRDYSAGWEDAGHPSPHIGDDGAERRFWTGLYARFLDHLGVDDGEGAIADAVFERFLSPGSFGPFEDTEPALDDLAARGVRLGIVSNWGSWLRPLLDETSLTDRFGTIVISAEEGIEKPDPAIFERALIRLGETSGAHVAYVGDDLRHDITPALALGLTPVLIDRLDLWPEHEGLRVRSLAELPDVLTLPARMAVAQ